METWIIKIFGRGLVKSGHPTPYPPQNEIRGTRVKPFSYCLPTNTLFQHLMFWPKSTQLFESETQVF